jgi:hypothetical protein
VASFSACLIFCLTMIIAKQTTYLTCVISCSNVVVCLPMGQISILDTTSLEVDP